MTDSRKPDEILANYLDQIDNGEPVDRGALLLEHPEIASQLARFFDDCDAVSQVVRGSHGELLGETQGLNANWWKQRGENGQSTDYPSGTPNDISLNEILSCLEHLDELCPNNGYDESSQNCPPPPLARVFLQRNGSTASLGRFNLRRVLGRGGFGIVFLADDPSLSRSVALKIPRPEIMFSRQAKQRFIREAQLAALLDHPAIVPIYETGEIGRLWYIAGAYCNGPTLAAWLRQRPEPVSPRLAAHIVRSLSEAVQHAHSRGVLHRDLKPSNILLEPLERPKSPEFCFVPRVTDFGLGTRLEEAHELTKTGMLLGTSRYMAPEQARGDAKSIGVATDIYALGVILYELLTGRPPFVGKSDLEILRAIQHDLPPEVSLRSRKVPRDLQAICLKCLAKQPQLRYSNASELGADLKCYLSGQPVTARSIGPLTRTARWASRNRVASALFGVIVVSLIAVTWLLIVAERRHELAEDSRREARATVDKLFTETSNFLPEYPGTAELQRRLLTLARDAYEEFSREQSYDPQIQAEAARAAFRLAIIEGPLGHSDKSLAHARDALKRFQDLSRRFPDNEQFRFDIFHCRFLLLEYAEAFRVISDLCQRNARPEYRDALAAVSATLGQQMLNGEDPAAAKRMFQLGLETAERLSTEFSDVPSYRRHVGTNAVHLSRLCAMGGDFAGAFQWAQKAEQVGQELLESSPLNPGYAADHCGYCAMCASTAYALGEFDVVRLYLDEWAAVARQWTSAHPDATASWSEVDRSQLVRMEFEADSGNIDAAKRLAADYLATLEIINSRWPSPGGHLELARYLSDNAIEELRDVDRARDILHSVPDGCDPLCVGIVQLRTGQIEQAIHSLNSVSPANRWLARLYLGLAYTMLGDDAAASAVLPSGGNWDASSPEHGLLRSRILKEVEQYRRTGLQPVDKPELERTPPGRDRN
jgi:serine/threonine protein kinase